MENKTFNEYAIIELFGRQKIAGKITEQLIGANSFIRVDIPKTKTISGFTRLFGQGAIYSITITDEETAKMAAEMYTPEPIERWKVSEHFKMIENNQDQNNNFDEDEFFKRR